jgi:hypothetical protein
VDTGVIQVHHSLLDMVFCRLLTWTWILIERTIGISSVTKRILTKVWFSNCKPTFHAVFIIKKSKVHLFGLGEKPAHVFSDYSIMIKKSWNNISHGLERQQNCSRHVFILKYSEQWKLSIMDTLATDSVLNWEVSWLLRSKWLEMTIWDWTSVSWIERCPPDRGVR